ncbi:IPT/TIG domain-containing protein [Microbacterium sp. RD1]|uniref:IPT/TIG domain-containing protein n=1 Tax=Microbacterium sp. RD1 TaxID=3457313 RepID=UPI003FA55377
MTAALVLVGTVPAIAAEGDRSEAEGRFLGGGSALVDLDAIAALDGYYTAFPPANAGQSEALDVTALGAVDLGLGVSLFGGSSALELGAVDQYARADAAGSFGSSGLIGPDGAIVAGDGGPGTATTVTLTPVLDDLGVTGTISTAELVLSALGAEAEATRAATVTTTGDYNIGTGTVVLTAPVLGALIDGLADDLAAVDAELDVLADGLEADVDADLGGLLGIVDDVIPAAALDTDVAVDLGPIDLAAVLDVLDDPISSDDGTVTIVPGAGTISIDLGNLYTLNDLPANTTLFGATPDGVAARAALQAALDDVLLDNLPTVLEDAIQNSTPLSIDVSADVTDGGALAGGIDIAVDGTVGGLLGNAGEPPVTVTAASDIPLLGLLELDAIEAEVTAAVLPDVADALGDVPLAAIDDALGAVAAGLDPLVDVLDSVVRITVNVQETPGTFGSPEAGSQPSGPDVGFFTQRAVRVEIAPLLGGVVTLDLASATVRAIPLAAPVALGITPPRGPVTGGTPVTITGTGLTGTSEVTFDGVPGTALTVNPAGTSLTVTTPANTAGPATVGITNIDGTDTSLSFEYFEIAAIDDITPDFGFADEETTVTITGVCFTDATEVLFGAVAGEIVSVTDTEITVVAPTGTTGPVDVTVVTSSADCGTATEEDGFLYVAPGAPVIDDLDPPRGPETGGTEVTISGDDFEEATGVTIDGVEVPFEVNPAGTEITVTTPPHAPGVVDVVVTNPSGDSAPFDFEYIDVAEITGVDPDAGPLAGGNTVIITGDCFTGATAVLFDGVAAAFTVDSDTQITAVAPASADEGVVDIEVVGAGDCGEAVAEDAYEYFAAPVVTDLDPAEGPETGGTEVTLTGTGFEGTTGVTFDGVPATSFEIVSDTEITAVSPAHAPGVVEVTVLHPGGNADAGDFAYLNIPSISGITPDQGPEDGGTVVVISGEGFTGATSVTFDGVPATAFTVDNDGQITATTPAHVPATVPVVVGHPNGNSPSFAFTYVAGTEVSAVTPPGGPLDGGNAVVITGVCFTGATGVLFGAVPATSFTVDSDSQITAVAPAGTGVVDVTVVGAAACGTDSLPDAYEYTDDPVIAALTPGTGPQTGGTVVTITGVNFTGVTRVTFDGVDGTNLVVVSDTELRVTTPAGAPGAAEVRVFSPAGVSDPGSFVYTPVTTVTGVTPGSGPTGGGSVVTITGQCFTGATAVLFGGTASPSFTVVSDTQIRATTPARTTVGDVTVTVVGAGTCGTGALAGGFSYFPGPALAATGGDAPFVLGLMGAVLVTAGGAVWAMRRREV